MPAALAVLLPVAATVGLALRATPAGSPVAAPAAPQTVEVPYNGAFTFTRVRYGSGRRGFFRGGGDWAHDYPDADRNMQMILDEFTSMVPNTSGSNVVDLEDPEIFRHPVLYMSEPGFWRVTEEGAANLREHLQKGGFIIFDDFDGFGHWENFTDQMQRVLPGRLLIELEPTHPVFDTFFHVEDIYVPHPFQRTRPSYFAVFEDDDPNGRIMALINYDSDLAEYWEYAATGYFPVDPTNDAFKLGVNYLIYAVTR